MASNLLMNISQDERERAIFRSRKKFQMDIASDMATAKDIGRREGMEEATKEFEIKIKNRDEEIERLKEELNKYKMATGD